MNSKASVYGKVKGNSKDYTYNNFIKTKVENEEFYPFLTNQYSGIACYKMKKILFEDLFLIMNKYPLQLYK